MGLMQQIDRLKDFNERKIEGRNNVPTVPSSKKNVEVK